MLKAVLSFSMNYFPHRNMNFYAVNIYSTGYLGYEYLFLVSN